MSIQTNTYIIYGVVLPFDTFEEERHEELEPYMDSAFKGIHHHNNLCILFDGMCGKYVAIGHVIAKTGNNEGFGTPVKLGIPQLPICEIELAEQISILTRKPLVALDWYVLSHYR